MAIGADERGVLGLVLRQGARIAAVGVIIGLILAAVASRALESGLLGIAVAHPMVYAVVPVLMMIVALAACYVPALRASRVDPMRALRTE
jgi:ABC-type antimicrobial peptide transport system permease subunit